MVIAIAVFIILYHLIVLYIGWNGWKWLRIETSGRRGIRYIFWTVLLLMAWSPFVRYTLSDWAGIHWIAGVWMGLLYLLILLLPAANLIVWLLKRLSRFSRDRLIASAGRMVTAAAVLLFGFGLWSAYSPVVRHYDVTLPKAAGETESLGKAEGETEPLRKAAGKTEPLRIVMAADMHFGALSHAGHARRFVEEVNALQPDVVLIPGDLVDDDIVHYVKQGIPAILQGIQAPVYASLGNHDLLEAGDSTLIDTLEASGMTVLLDESVKLGGDLMLVGRKDASDPGRMPIEQLMQGADPASPVILLDHQPDDLDAEEAAGADLVLSGHTHRGQVFPGGLITGRIYENDYGYLKKGRLQSIVTSGYGFWGLPLRIGTRSELNVIELTFAPAP